MSFEQGTSTSNADSAAVQEGNLLVNESLETIQTTIQTSTVQKNAMMDQLAPIHLQVSNPKLRALLLLLEVMEDSTASACDKRMTISEAANATNKQFEEVYEEITTLGSEDFAVFAGAVNARMMLLTKGIYSKHASRESSFEYRCIRRKDRRELGPAKRKRNSSLALAGVKCLCGYRVLHDPSRSDIVVPLKGNAEHAIAKHEVGMEPFPECTPFTIADIQRNENYIKGTVTSMLREQALAHILRMRQSYTSLGTTQIHHQIEIFLHEFGIGFVPETLKRRIADMLTMSIHEKIESNSVGKLIERLDRENIPFDTFERNNVVEAIYWADPRLVTDPITGNMLVHDVSFGIIDTVAGFEKFSILATAEPTGNSQILIAGVSLSDHQQYFEVMLRLLKRQYPVLATQKSLLIFSDEDRAFINATHSELPNAKNFICLWYKKRHRQNNQDSEDED